MTGKQNAVFWVGLILIATNFWVSGQSSTLWKSFSVKAGTAPAPRKTTKPKGKA